MFVVLILILLLFGINLLWQRRRERQRKLALTRQLYAWAGKQATLDPVLQQWIKRLPANEAAVLVELLEGYCHSLQWELAWLFAPQIERAPVLKAALEESVMTYAHSLLTALQMEADVQAYQTYVMFSGKPAARKHRPLVGKLYKQLDQAGLTVVPEPPTKASFLRRYLPQRPTNAKAAQKALTHKEQVATIQRVFTQEPARAMESLKQVLLQDAVQTVADVQPQRQLSLDMTSASVSA